MQCCATRSIAFGYDVVGDLRRELHQRARPDRAGCSTTRPPCCLIFSADENGVKTVITPRQLRPRARSTTDSARRRRRRPSPTRTTTATRRAVRHRPHQRGQRGQSSVFIDRFGRTRYRSWSTFSGGSGVCATVSTTPLGNITRDALRRAPPRPKATVSADGSVDPGRDRGGTRDRAGGLRPRRAGWCRRRAAPPNAARFRIRRYGETAIVDGEGLSSMHRGRLRRPRRGAQAGHDTTSSTATRATARSRRSPAPATTSNASTSTSSGGRRVDHRHRRRQQHGAPQRRHLRRLRPHDRLQPRRRRHHSELRRARPRRQPRLGQRGAQTYQWGTAPATSGASSAPTTTTPATTS